MVHPHLVYRVVLVVQVDLEILFDLSLPEGLGVQADLKLGASVLTMAFYLLELKKMSLSVFGHLIFKRLFPVYITSIGTDEKMILCLCRFIYERKSDLDLVSRQYFLFSKTGKKAW